MRLIAAAAALGIVLASTAGCSGDDDSPESAPTYELSPRPVRPDEKALKLAPVSDGDTSFSVIGFTVMPEITGSHANVKARGKFVRVRLVMVNNGRTTTLVDVNKQRLLSSDGASSKPDYDAMIVKRQPFKFDLGAAMRVEFDLWYDIPAAAKPTALRLYGGSTLTDMKDEEGTDLRLP
ncbi:DUF4352 domain-containing protein [Spirillospora sp. NPDC048911]|uniref:DUF4352 domain-containing protein n=1 Tax=Spirillospora sp. NPDC048911 TaxID=3364527 RepID=UPI0037161EFA